MVGIDTYQTRLYPLDNSPYYKATYKKFQCLKRHILQKPHFTAEVSTREWEGDKNHEYLEYRNGKHLIQVWLNYIPEDRYISLGVQFTYCNPITIDDIAFSIATDLAKELKTNVHLTNYDGNKNEFHPEKEREELKRAYVDSLAENRRLWRLDFGDEEIALPPGEALCYFSIKTSGLYSDDRSGGVEVSAATKEKALGVMDFWSKRNPASEILLDTLQWDTEIHEPLPGFKYTVEKLRFRYHTQP